MDLHRVRWGLCLAVLRSEVDYPFYRIPVYYDANLDLRLGSSALANCCSPPAHARACAGRIEAWVRIASRPQSTRRSGLMGSRESEDKSSI